MKQRSDDVVLNSLLGKVERIPIGGCWLWTASKMANGYGQIGYKGKNAYAHRVSSKDNMHDMISKGRQNFNWKKGKPPGNKGKRSAIAKEKHGMAKLTETDVASIRSRYANGETQKSLGLEYGVIQPHISRIVRNRNCN